MTRVNCGGSIFFFLLLYTVLAFTLKKTGFPAKLAWSETELKPTAVLLLAALSTPLDEASVFLGETSLYIEPRTSSPSPIVLSVCLSVCLIYVVLSRSQSFSSLELF